jgi:hypothetical protein
MYILFWKYKVFSLSKKMYMYTHTHIHTHNIIGSLKGGHFNSFGDPVCYYLCSTF